jgi:hypothetical protein
MHHPSTLAMAALLLAAATTCAAQPAGHPDTLEAEKLLGLPEPTGRQELSGTVIEALDSNSYSYLLIEHQGGREWLAAPRTALRPGQRIAFTAGHRFAPWYSKKLHRTFAAVTFVPGVEPLPAPH